MVEEKKYAKKHATVNIEELKELTDEQIDARIATVLEELDGVKAENYRLKFENVFMRKELQEKGVELKADPAARPPKERKPKEAKQEDKDNKAQKQQKRKRDNNKKTDDGEGDAEKGGKEENG